jgi:Phage integrase family
MSRAPLAQSTLGDQSHALRGTSHHKNRSFGARTRAQVSCELKASFDVLNGAWPGSGWDRAAQLPAVAGRVLAEHNPEVVAIEDEVFNTRPLKLHLQDRQVPSYLDRHMRPGCRAVVGILAQVDLLAVLDAHVFCMPEGGPLDYAHWRVRHWLPATTAVGLPWLTFHDLRRANATALVTAGVDLKTAQTRLGHSDPRLTLAVYAQATTAADRDAADRVAALFQAPAEAEKDGLVQDECAMGTPEGTTLSAPARR